MTKEQIKALRELAGNVMKNKPKVLKRFRKAGIKKPIPALVYTIAKYYDCFERLAKE